MKKLILFTIALTALQITAQNHPNRAERMQDFTPEEMATLRTKKMTLALDLNASQQAQIQEINLENATLRKAHMEKRQARKASGNTNKPSKEEYLKMQHAKLDHQIEVKAKMKDILNAEQYSKWEKMQARKAAKKRDHKKAKMNAE